MRALLRYLQKKKTNLFDIEKLGNRFITMIAVCFYRNLSQPVLSLNSDTINERKIIEFF